MLNQFGYEPHPLNPSPPAPLPQAGEGSFNVGRNNQRHCAGCKELHLLRHSRADGNPGTQKNWTPAFAGVTFGGGTPRRGS